MRSGLLYCGLAAALMLAVGCTLTTGPGVPSGMVLPEGDEIELTVHGLSCPLCATNLDAQLERLPGVAESRINLDTGRVQISRRPGTTLTAEELAGAVHDAGFTLREIHAGAEDE